MASDNETETFTRLVRDFEIPDGPGGVYTIDKPTIEDILAKSKRWHSLSIGEQNDAWDYYMAMLADTMRESERLRGALEKVADRDSDDGMWNASDIKDYVDGVIASNEHSEKKRFFANDVFTGKEGEKGVALMNIPHPHKHTSEKIANPWLCKHCNQDLRAGGCRVAGCKLEQASVNSESEGE